MTFGDPAPGRTAATPAGRLARATRVGIVTALAIAAGGAARAPQSDPDSSEIHAAAVEALSRAEIREIVGMNLGVEARAQDISGLLRDLNAEVRGQEVVIALSADVLFDFDRADLRPEAKPSLDKVVAVLRSYSKSTARIEGHTDSKGDDAYNRKLSERRAESVRKWLAANGASLRMSTRGWGEKKPVAPNAKPDGKDDPEGRQKNRRVEITVKKL